MPQDDVAAGLDRFGGGFVFGRLLAHELDNRRVLVVRSLSNGLLRLSRRIDIESLALHGRKIRTYLGEGQSRAVSLTDSRSVRCLPGDVLAAIH